MLSGVIVHVRKRTHTQPLALVVDGCPSTLPLQDFKNRRLTVRDTWRLGGKMQNVAAIVNV